MFGPLLDRGRHRLGVDQVVRHEVLALGLREALAHRALDAHQAGAELVLRKLADGTHTAVSEVVDVVDLAAAVAQLDQDLDDRDDVVVGQRHLPGELVAADAAVELHAADVGEVVAVLVEEEPAEERLHRVLGGRLAGAHHAVDRDLRVQRVGGLVHAQRLRDVRPLVEVVGVERLDFLDAGIEDLLQQRLGDLVVRVGDDFARLLVDEVLGERAADEEVGFDGELLHPRGLHLADVLHRDALVFLHDDLAGLRDDVELGDLAAHALGNHLELDALLGEVEGVEGEEVRQDLLGRVAEGLQQDRHRHLAAAVDAEIEVVLGVELEIEPRAAIRDHARREEELTRGMRLAAVVFEEHARRAVQLRDDDALGAVDDEGAVAGHERDFAHVDLLLLHFLHRGLGGFAVHDREAHFGAQRAREGEAALLALDHVERRLAERVAHVLEARVAGVAGDREYRREGRLQAHLAAAVARPFGLEELRVRVDLGGKEEGHIQNGRALGEALADAFLLGERVGHRGSEITAAQGRGSACTRLALMAWWLAPTSRWRTAMPGVPNLLGLLETRMARPNRFSAVASENT